VRACARARVHSAAVTTGRTLVIDESNTSWPFSAGCRGDGGGGGGGGGGCEAGFFATYFAPLSPCGPADAGGDPRAWKALQPPDKGGRQGRAAGGGGTERVVVVGDDSALPAYRTAVPAEVRGLFPEGHDGAALLWWFATVGAGWGGWWVRRGADCGCGVGIEGAGEVTARRMPSRDR
jgi:hypothetical protein